jgi:hypothetical protein
LIFAPFGWCHAEPLPEAAVEIRQGSEAGIKRNRADLFASSPNGGQLAMSGGANAAAEGGIPKSRFMLLDPAGAEDAVL